MCASGHGVHCTIVSNEGAVLTHALQGHTTYIVIFPSGQGFSTVIYFGSPQRNLTQSDLRLDSGVSASTRTVLVCHLHQLMYILMDVAAWSLLSPAPSLL